VRIHDLQLRARRPEPFQPSEAPFWDDPHISTYLLAAHLDDDVEEATRPVLAIRATVDRLVREGIVGPGTRVLDLGCGPGRYAELLASVGCYVTGVDFSTRSIAYARARAAERGLDIDYREQDFHMLDDVAAFDVVLQVYGELSTFADDVRDALLATLRRAVVPGGLLIFDVSTPAHRRRVGQRHEWTVHDAGFWRPEPHLILADGFAYPGDVWCNQYLVATDGDATAYRMWFHDYVPETITPVLERAGFVVEETWDALDGAGCGHPGEWLAVLARATSAATGRTSGSIGSRFRAR
jgi:SAM-dependent methyltransferase